MTGKTKRPVTSELLALIELCDAAECAYKDILCALPDGPLPDWFIRLESAAKKARAVIFNPQN